MRKEVIIHTTIEELEQDLKHLHEARELIRTLVLEHVPATGQSAMWDTLRNLTQYTRKLEE